MISIIPWLVWAISIVGYAIVSLMEYSLANIVPERVQWLVAQRVRRATYLEFLFANHKKPVQSLVLLKILFLALNLLSISIATNLWVYISLMGLVSLVILGLINTTTKTIANVHGESIALRIAFMVHYLIFIFKPILTTEDLVQNRLLKTRANATPKIDYKNSMGARPTFNTELEPLDEREAQMIRGVARLDKTIAREIMVPSVDIVAAKTTTSIKRLAELMVSSGHSRIPVFEDSLDQIQGIIYARDIVDYLNSEQNPSESVRKTTIRPAKFIPETKTLEELLNQFQGEQVHIAIVIDEYGGVSGLVTIEDLLEEIVGEIEDEFDTGESDIESVGNNGFLIDARVSIDQLRELLEVDIEADGFDTVGGLVYQRLGKIPGSGDSVYYDGVKIEVISTVGRGIKKLRVTKKSGHK